MFRIGVKKAEGMCRCRRYREPLEAAIGISLMPESGMLVRQQNQYMGTEDFYLADKGSCISLLDKSFSFAVATYSLIRDDKYIYTYAYQEEENWSTYNHDFIGEASFGQGNYLFKEKQYFRIIIRKKDGSAFQAEDAGRINEILAFYRTKVNYSGNRLHFENEINRTVECIMEKTTQKSLVFGLLSDTHYTVNGTWEDTAHNISAVNKRAVFDAIVHLGDVTDGMVSRKICRDYTNRVIGDLLSNNVPVFFCIGNHDTNYFKKNPEALSYGEQYALYLRRLDKNVKLGGQQLYYYVDYKHIKLRCLFLYTFDHREQIRYGFDLTQVEWVRRTLKDTPEGYKIIVFGHDAPLARLDYWANEIRNGEELVRVLEEYHRQEGNCVMAYVHGHTHADFVYRERSFPIISVGCSKCEYFPDKKPEGSVRQERKPDSLTQELWDIMVITPQENRLDFIRFGAGEDRTVYCS